MKTSSFGDATNFDSLERGSCFLLQGRNSGHFAIKIGVTSGDFVGAAMLSPPDPQDGAPIIWSGEQFANEVVMNLPKAILMPTKNPSLISLSAGRNFRLGALYQSKTQLIMAASYKFGRLMYFDVCSGEVQASPPGFPSICIYAWTIVHPGLDEHDELASFKCEEAYPDRINAASGVRAKWQRRPRITLPRYPGHNFAIAPYALPGLQNRLYCRHENQAADRRA